MNELFKFLSTNTTVTTVLLTIVSITLLSILVLIIIAFIQNREITFWPPKIGPKTFTNKQALTPNNNVLEMNDRSQYPPFIPRLQKAELVCLMGINVDGVLSQYDGFITARAKEGCKFRILIVDSQFFDSDEFISTSWPGGFKSQRDLGHSLDIMTRILRNVGSENFQIRFTPFPPPYTLLLIDPDKPIGEVQVEIYSFQPHSHKRPHIILKKPDNEHWYNYFISDFDLAWNNARIFEPNQGMKRVREKAGVFVYRKNSAGAFEFLIITSRLNPKNWVFPGGMKENGETLEQTAIRECMEESGYIAEIDNNLGTIELDKGEIVDRITLFLAHEKGQAASFEIDRQRKWVGSSELIQLIVDDFKPITFTAINCLKQKEM